MRRSAELRQLIHCSDAAAWTANSEHPRECSANEGFKATTQKFVLRSDSFSAMVFRLGSILLPAVFGLNVLLLRCLQVSRRFIHIRLLNPSNRWVPADHILLLREKAAHLNPSVGMRSQ